MWPSASTAAGTGRAGGSEGADVSHHLSHAEGGSGLVRQRQDAQHPLVRARARGVAALAKRLVGPRADRWPGGVHRAERLGGEGAGDLRCRRWQAEEPSRPAARSAGRSWPGWCGSSRRVGATRSRSSTPAPGAALGLGHVAARVHRLPDDGARARDLLAAPEADGWRRRARVTVRSRGGKPSKCVRLDQAGRRLSPNP